MNKYIHICNALLMAVIAGTVQAAEQKIRNDKAKIIVNPARSTPGTLEFLKKHERKIATAGIISAIIFADRGTRFSNVAHYTSAAIGTAGLVGMVKSNEDKLKEKENINLLLDYMRHTQNSAPQNLKSIIAYINDVALMILKRTIIFPENTKLLDLSISNN